VRYITTVLRIRHLLGNGLYLSSFYGTSVTMPATPNSYTFSFCNEPRSDSEEEGWDITFGSGSGSESESSLSSLSSVEFRFPSSERELSPAVDNQRKYNPDERLNQ
jgi:hypothetical protein